MKRWLLLIGLMVFAPLLSCSGAKMFGAAKPAKPEPVCEMPQVCFSPNGGCEQMIVRFIDAADYDTPIHVMAYNFTSDPIGDALARAAKRGVEVDVIVDYGASQQKGVEIGKVKKAGATVWVDRKHKIAHSKVTIIGNAVQTGSFNYSESAEKANQENALIIHCGHEFAQQYLTFWETHRSHSTKAP